MDIRTKVIFALVAVALASMFAFGAVVAPDVERRLRSATLSEIDELAESKREALLWILQGWRDRTALVASRTQLRASLGEYTRTRGGAPVERIRGILSDALQSSGTVTLLQVLDLEGGVVASATRGTGAPLPARAFLEARSDEDRVRYAGVEFVAGPPQVSFVAPLTRDGQRIGTLLAVFEARELLELTGHYHGLGESGEVLLIAPDAEGAPRTLHPTRHEPGRVDGIRFSTQGGSLAARALSGEVGPVWEGVTDYRGEEVWAGTRPIVETGWGLVVKVDGEEQMRPYTAFASSMRRTAVILSAFAILAGFVLGLRFASPIHHLSEVANRIRGGEMTARATVTREDEVGLLARTFNEMANELEERMSLLNEFRKFFDVSIDMMCMAGTDGFFKRVNPAFERALGWSEDDLLERPFFDFVHPHDVEKTEKEVDKLTQGIPTISFENRYRCKDGTYRHLRWASYPDPATGMLYAIAHVMDDKDMSGSAVSGGGDGEGPGTAS